MNIDFLERRAGERRFRIYVPPAYDDAQSVPAVLFLHGAGERGNNSIAPTTVGIGPALRNRAEPYPAIVIFPQCPAETLWSTADALAAVDATAGEFHIDAARIALTGISMGGAGVWKVAADLPDRFVSLAPICGWLTTSDPVEFALRIAHVPTWIFHGDEDNIVPVDASRVMAEAMQEAHADVVYTEFRGVGHNSWDRAYQKTALLDWLIGVSSAV